MMKTHTKLALILSLSSVTLLCACSSSSMYEPSGNPLLDLRNPELLERDRVAAAQAAWVEVEQGIRDRERTRYAMKNLAWSGGTDTELRLVIIDLLMSDRSTEGDADSRAMARLLLPTERDQEAVRVIAYHAIESGWDELIPSFVRSLSRPIPGVPDQDRAEFEAIQRLSGDFPIERVVFDVFLNPTQETATQQENAVLRSGDRTRDQAWGLLGRLDQSGEMRDQFISSVDIADERIDAQSRELIEDLRLARDELGVLPDTSMEVAWLGSLRHHEDARNRAQNELWWAETRSAVRSLQDFQRQDLRLRNLEPIRWVHQNQPGWLNLDREGVFGLLNSRLRGRTVHKRKPGRGEEPRLERLGDWIDRMSWGDLLTVLVVDQSLESEQVQKQLFTQRALDKKDDSTEYGGVIESGSQFDWRAVLFRPRQRDRISDERFVASDDMFRFSDRSLAHYHFHANERNNARHAGPSIQDLRNALASQRTGVVLTSLSSDELNADVYFGNGVVVDLGVIDSRSH